MKIAIVSMYGWLKIWSNYGTLFQNYALQKYLNSLNHETYWIRNKPTHILKKPNEYSFLELTKSPRLLIQWIKWIFYGRYKSQRMEKFNKDHPRKFSLFLEKWVPTTESELTIEELINSPPNADAYIVGSDMIWRDVTPLTFLAFGGSDITRIAYAVSAPWPALSKDWHVEASKEIQRFKAVSVRENDGVVTCQHLGFSDVTTTADPTLLLTRKDYLDLVNAENMNKPFNKATILGYFVNVKKHSHMPWNQIKKFSIRQNADLKVIPLQGTELIIPKHYIYTPTPAEWINAFDKAECIVTNSFHGALFSIIMQKPFLVFLQTSHTAKSNSRFISTLGTLGLSNRIITAEQWKGASVDELHNLMNSEINWDEVNSQLEKFVEKSKNFLITALQR